MLSSPLNYLISEAILLNFDKIMIRLFKTKLTLDKIFLLFHTFINNKTTFCKGCFIYQERG
ncbi:MAG: hypothetical protein KatS3mg088_787 [Patescibacteria group bacterium]|nr:MAG: hypothetical protein KatS3mg088_787 [Patescibacteria group bacterium]